MASIDCSLDTNVLIKLWRGDALLREATANRACGIETVACLEFLQGVNNRQREKADEFIAHFEFIPFTAPVSQLAVDLVRKFAHFKGLRMADALIASSALHLDVGLVTLNIKHFDFIDGIKLI